jgi:hypothetical protein
MNRFMSPLMAILLISFSAVAQQESPDPGPQVLEPAVEPAADRVVKDGDKLDWVENFMDPEGNAPQVSMEELKQMVPAVLSVERKVQHQEACQYWLKMNNRLPFKIRNMALRFSAYIKEPGYDRAILFDTAIKSFSELRPTDSQYRDIFFEHANCDKLEFIRVEDTGRCSVGELTKFSAQSGDCARFIEVQENEELCIYLDTSMLDQPADAEQSNVHRSPDNPCGLIIQADVDVVLEQFKVNYEAGNLDGFVALFDEAATSNGGEGRDQIKTQYGALFSDSKSRQLEFKRVSWEPKRNGSAVIQFGMAATVDKDSFWGPDRYDVKGQMTLIKRKGGIYISSFFHDQNKVIDLPSFL